MTAKDYTGLAVGLREAERRTIMILGEENFDIVLGLKSLMEARNVDVSLGMSSRLDDEPYNSKLLDWLEEFDAEDGEMETEGKSLARMGLVRSTRSGVLELTEDGRRVYEVIKTQSEQEEVVRVQNLAGYVKELPEEHIMGIVLRYYPFMAGFDTSSPTYGDLISARRRLAGYLYRENKLGVRNAELMAGTDVESLLKDAGRRRTRRNKFREHMTIEERVEELSGDARGFLLMLSEHDRSLGSAPTHTHERGIIRSIFPEPLGNDYGEMLPPDPAWDEIAEDAKDLVDSGLIEDNMGSGFDLTDDGRKACEVIRERSGEEVQQAEKFKEFLDGLTEEEFAAHSLLGSPYREANIQKSEAFTNLLAKRVELAASMYAKNKIDVQRAALIADMDVNEFLAYIEEHGSG